MKWTQVSGNRWILFDVNTGKALAGVIHHQRDPEFPGHFETWFGRSVGFTDSFDTLSNAQKAITDYMDRLKPAQNETE